MAKTKSHGTTVSVATNAIGGLREINLTGAEVPFVDLTTHDSTAKEFTSGLIDNGTLELSGLFDSADAGQDHLRSNAGASAAFVVTLPNTKTISFSAIIGAMNEGIPLEDGVSFTVSCKLTGTKTYAT